MAEITVANAFKGEAKFINAPRGASDTHLIFHAPEGSVITDEQQAGLRRELDGIFAKHGLSSGYQGSMVMLKGLEGGDKEIAISYRFEGGWGTKRKFARALQEVYNMTDINEGKSL